jgi:hypothetical protein
MCLLPMEKREMLCTRQLYNKEYKKILKQISYIKYQSRNEKNLSYYRDLQRVLPLVLYEQSEGSNAVLEDICLRSSIA